ncbi:hypothetical protein CDAR_288801 [Caerostris darwini]|uniref:Uncharacterized protein n=1 Tax=Caerostris darwini TaxID=1538125 RepID=A0AAV4PN26_9ARAC|nr:hypothetical protein CDAR_288801 [Caerostris darwini]
MLVHFNSRSLSEDFIFKIPITRRRFRHLSFKVSLNCIPDELASLFQDLTVQSFPSKDPTDCQMSWLLFPWIRRLNPLPLKIPPTVKQSTINGTRRLSPVMTPKSPLSLQKIPDSISHWLMLVREINESLVKMLGNHWRKRTPGPDGWGPCSADYWASFFDLFL